MAINEFKKEEFARLLQKSRQEMNQTELSHKAGVSWATLSTYANAKSSHRPSVGLIRKLCDASTILKFDELMVAAGYDPADYTFKSGEDIALAEEKAEGLILASLFKAGDYPFERLDIDLKDNWKANQLPSLSINVTMKDNRIVRWYFYHINNVNRKLLNSEICILFGQVSLMPHKNTKHSFVTFSREIFDKLCEQEMEGRYPYAISAILVDEKQNTIIERPVITPDDMLIPSIPVKK